jgi:hypothetical protein
MVEAKAGKQFQLRIPNEFFVAIDEWRRHQADLPTRSEAIRRLVKSGLGRARGSDSRKEKT